MFLVGGGVVGWYSGITKWTAVPLLLLCGISLGEIHRIIIMKRYRVPEVVETETVSLSLFRPLTTCDLAVRHYRVSSAAESLRGIRIVHLSDFHISNKLPYDYYTMVMERAVGLNPDLLFLTGDLVRNLKSCRMLPGVLTKAGARLGTFAVLGNHDHWYGAEEITEVVRSCSINVLGNGWVRVATDSGTIIVSGLEEPWSPDAWQQPPSISREPTLVLTHTADNIYRLNKAGADAVFAGHYHGGQTNIPWLGSVVIPSKYGRRFVHGHFNVHGTDLFVTAGVGVGEPPVRIYCRPEILVVDFTG